MTNKETATALFTAARFIGRQEDNDWYISVNYNGVVISRYFYDIGGMTTARRNLGGKWDKVTSEAYFSLVQIIGENVKVELQTARNTACTPRVVGTETVEVKDYSSVPTKTIERDIVEWDCNPVLDA
jgi:hypothetical protein